MQTPGRQTEPQTPMIPMERRMDLAYDRLLARATDEAKNLERPQVRVLGRIITQMEQMNVSMRNVREQIREDVRAKRRYFREESKILRKDSENLDNVKTNILSSLRGKGAAVLGGLGAAQLSTGNLGGAAQSFGLAGALMAPEIVEFLTGSVVQVLALKGLIGNKGVGASNVAKGVGGASKLRNPLLITAALAASLLIPSLAQAGQSGDKRRQELATKVISGEQTINKPDVTRFRGQLNRFERILSSISFDGKKTKENTIDLEKLENEKQLDKKSKENKNNNNNNKEGVAPEGFMRGITGLLDFATFNLFDLDKRGDGKNKEKENNISLIEGNTNIDLASNVGDTIIDGDNLEIDDSTKISLVNNLTENSIFNDEISNIISPNQDLASNLLPNLDISQMGKQIVLSEANNNIIDLSSNQEEQPAPSGFSGIAAKSASISVATRFNTGGGTIDKFEAASSLRSYGAYS